MSSELIGLLAGLADLEEAVHGGRMGKSVYSPQTLPFVVFLHPGLQQLCSCIAFHHDLLLYHSPEMTELDRAPCTEVSDTRSPCAFFLPSAG